MRPRSLPACGSVIENEASASPAAIAGSQRSRCASLPWRTSSAVASPVGLTAPVSEIQPCDSVRQAGTRSRTPKPWPPCSLGTSAAVSPISTSRSSAPSGSASARSHSSTCGRTVSSTKHRTAS